MTELSSDFFTDSSKSAMRAIFSSFSLEECRWWLEDPTDGLGIELTLEEESNKWFPTSNSSREVRDRLLEACLKRGMRCKTRASVEDMERTERGTWRLRLKDGGAVEGRRVIFATGGMSFPNLGTDGTGMRLLERKGHRLNPPFPALTPLKGRHPGASPPSSSAPSTSGSRGPGPTTSAHHLAGISLDVSLAIRKAAGAGVSKSAAKKKKEARRTGFLFTHRGFSGPSVLDLSSQLIKHMEHPPQPGVPPPAMVVNWTGETREEWESRLDAKVSGGATMIASLMRKNGVPQRLADALCDEVGVPPSKQIGSLSKVEREAVLRVLTSYQLVINGNEGYGKAEVTGGGVPLEEVDLKTMESKVLPGVHVCGECLDIFGRIGGFNFYSAWTSGRLAGIGAAKGLRSPSPITESVHVAAPSSS